MAKAPAKRETKPATKRRAISVSPAISVSRPFAHGDLVRFKAVAGQHAPKFIVVPPPQAQTERADHHWLMHWNQNSAVFNLIPACALVASR